MAFLPVVLFTDRRAWLAILTGWLLTIVGSTAISFALSRLAPGSPGPDLGDAPAAVKLVGIALFSPIVETLLMGGILTVLLRWLRGWQAAVASAALWGIAHSLMAPLWGAVIWWPFLIFSTLFVTWRGHGFWSACAVVAAVHILQNLFPALLIVFGA